MRFRMESCSAAVVVPHEGTWIEIRRKACFKGNTKVVPHEGTWIEILEAEGEEAFAEVVPHEGTWIEIYGKQLLPDRN